MKLRIAAGIAIFVVGLVYAFWPNANNSTNTASSGALTNGPLVDVLLPAVLSDNAQIGKLAFDAKCASCHGTNAAGQDAVAPPLIHKIYESNHHGDESFQQAAEKGVRGHHWPFGNMPPVEGLTRGDVKMIVAYIRELQRANGIS